MFQFSCIGLLFINISSFKSDTENNANFDMYQANVATSTPLSKEDKILIKSLQECNGYNAWQFITEFLNNGWTKNSINRLLVKCGTVERLPGSGRRRAIKTLTQLSRCCLVRKTNLRATKQSEKFHARRGSIDHHQFRGSFTKFCVSTAAIKTPSIAD